MPANRNRRFGFPKLARVLTSNGKTCGSSKSAACCRESGPISGSIWPYPLPARLAHVLDFGQSPCPTIRRIDPMDGTLSQNDLSHVVEADKAHVWHHLIQHKPFETIGPQHHRRGQRHAGLGHQAGKEHLDAVSGGVWTVNVGYGRERIARCGLRPAPEDELFRRRSGLDPRRAVRRKADREDAGANPRLLCQLGVRGEREGLQDGPPDRAQAVRRHASTRSSTATATITARRSAAFRPAVRTSATPSTGPSRPVSCACRIASNTAPMNRTARRRSITANGPPTQIEEVILREGPDTVGALCLEPVTAGGGVIVPPEGLLAKRAGDLPQIRHPAAYRRGRLRRWPHRHLVRLPALRRRARHRDDGQGRRLGLCRHRLLRHHRGGVRDVQGRVTRTR